MKKTTYHIFFTNLANPLKIDIILLLREKGRNVTELVKELKVEQSKISHALASLKHCNIVNVNQNGRERVYSLNKDTMIPILNMIDKHSMIHCGKKCLYCEGCGK